MLIIIIIIIIIINVKLSVIDSSKRLKGFEKHR